METLEILKTRKEEIIDGTISILGTAIGGNTGMFISNLAFYFNVDEETSQLTVDYYPFVGNQLHNENVFWTIPSHEIPDCSDMGIESLEDISDVDFSLLGYDSFIEGIIDNEVTDRENYSNIHESELSY